MEKKRLTVVVPVYFNEETLSDTTGAILRAGSRIPGVLTDIVYVDDGSGDGSFETLRALQESRPEEISIVRLSRNFGSMNAVLAGMRHAGGDCVAVLSADLQDPPELLCEMFDRWLRGSKAVLAVRAAREDSWTDRLWAGLYYRLLRRLALPHYPRQGFDFFLLDRQLVKDICQINEKNTSLMSLIVWLGYRPVEIGYVRRKRPRGRSRWTTAKKVKLFIDAFAGFSYFPVRFLSTMGFVFAGLGGLYAAYLAYQRLVNGMPVQGFATIVILVLVASGFQMIMLGTLGEYLWRTLDEARRRPPYVIDEVYPRQMRVAGAGRIPCAGKTDAC